MLQKTQNMELIVNHILINKSLVKKNKRKEVVEYSEDLRKELIPFINKEINLVAEFVKYSFKTDSTDFERMFEKTILFKNIQNEYGDTILAEHMWLDSINFDKCLGELEEGVLVSFNATVQLNLYNIIQVPFS